MAPNVFSNDFEHEMPAPFGLKATRVGAGAGAERLGATVYEIAPGSAVSPYHVHHANEEMLVVLSGEPSVRSPAGVRQLAAGDVVAFKAGPDGAHRVFNRSSSPARVLLVSTMVFPEIAEHLDTGATLSMTEPGAGKVLLEGQEVDFMEAWRRAQEAAPES